MLEQDNSITFTAELMQIIDTFLAEYEVRQGALRNDLERGLVISYVLGIMGRELGSIWDTLAESPAFASLHPRLVFEDCAQQDGRLSDAQRELIRDLFRKRGWVSSEATP